jgi:SecD-like export protein
MAVMLASCGTSVAPTPEPSALEPVPPAAVNRCLVTVLGLPAGVLISETDPIPPGSQVLAAPGDFDPGGTAVETNADGTSRLTIHLRGAAVERFATYTKGHIGDAVAIMVDGSVVSVPRIMEAIVGGEVSIDGGGPNSDFQERVAGCAL